MDDSDLRSKPPCHRADALNVIRTLRDAGHVAYFAGGCVRDLLLGLEPKDYDVATNALPQTVRSLFRDTQAVGQAFGVILVRLGRSVVEVATFRTDGPYTDGRRPTEVIFTTAEEDAKRRDFTINGLFFDPLADRLLDFVGGQADLQSKTLRAIGDPDARFQEDHLRLLRAVRFAARFHLHIDPVTQSAIIQHAPRLTHIGPERVGEELRLMLTPPTRLVARDLLSRLSLLPVILRFLPGATNAPARLFNAVAPAHPISFGLSLAALTLECQLTAGQSPAWSSLLSPDAIRRSVQACRKSLKISNDESDALAGALDILPLLQDSPPRLSTLKRFLARPTSHDARKLLEALPGVDPSLTRVAWLHDQFTQLAPIDVAPAPFITGDDLTAAGLSPGPLFKRILEAVYDAQLENQVHTSDAALRMALNLAQQ